jgi:predicted dehydrogenase
MKCTFLASLSIFAITKIALFCLAYSIASYIMTRCLLLVPDSTSVKLAINKIKSGELGTVINVRGVYGKSRIISFAGGWRSEREVAGGGILLDQGIHMVDLMRLFCGEFVEVKSFIDNSYWKHDIEDNAYAIMKDTKGRVAMLHSTATQWQHRFVMDIALTEGYIELHGILSGSKSYGEEKIIIGHRDDESINGQMESTVVNFLSDNSWSDEIFEFADAILNDKPIISGTSKDALETMKLVYNIYYNDKEWSTKYNILDPNL